MPRNYNIYDNSWGTNMVGRAYTPQVAPWNRMDDDVSVQPRHEDDRDRQTYERSDYDRDREDDRYAASGRHIWRAEDDRGRFHRR